jgi:hypothetical protein
VVEFGCDGPNNPIMITPNSADTPLAIAGHRLSQNPLSKPKHARITHEPLFARLSEGN